MPYPGGHRLGHVPERGLHHVGLLIVRRQRDLHVAGAGDDLRRCAAAAESLTRVTVCSFAFASGGFWIFE
jgi:hypothetical protein